MRFFSKLVFICNGCFLITVLMRYIELANKAKGNNEAIIKLAPLQYLLVILGYGAIFLNLIFFIMVALRSAPKKGTGLPRWITWFNLSLFLIQVYYFFFLL